MAAESLNPHLESTVLSPTPIHTCGPCSFLPSPFISRELKALPSFLTLVRVIGSLAESLSAGAQKRSAFLYDSNMEDLHH